MVIKDNCGLSRINRIMNNDLMLFNTEHLKLSFDKITKLYPDNKVSNNNCISNEHPETIKYNIVEESRKRNLFRNTIIENSEIARNAFCGTFFDHVAFDNCNVIGNSFVSSNFNAFKLSSSKLTIYSANNLSNGKFYDCRFENIHFLSSSWINCIIVNTELNNCIIQSCTMEGTIFNKCKLNDVNMSSTNLDYMILKNTILNNVTFPFYQFAYVIGIKNYLKEIKSNISFKANEKQITISEYRDCIEDLIYYYCGFDEYFPAANLLISLEKINDARDLIILGINKALNNLNYRLVKHFYYLCAYNDLLSYDLVNSIKQEIDNHLINLKNNNSTYINEALMQTVEITTLLDNRNLNKTSLYLEIQTNIDRNDFKAQQKINDLISDCKYIIDNDAFKNQGHTLTEISYCPIGIMMSILGDVGNLITLGTALQQFITYVKTKKSKNSREIAKSICKSYSNLDNVDMETKMELAKAKIENSMLEIKMYNGKKNSQDYNDFITGITQKIIGDLDETIDKDLLVFKINN